MVEAKTYRQLREDSERFSAALAKLGEQGNHVAIVGDSSYPWIVSYYGTVNSGSVAVPLDANLPEEELCELIDRSDAAVLVYDKARAAVAEMAKEKCPKLKYRIAVGQADVQIPEGTVLFETLLEEHNRDLPTVPSRKIWRPSCLPPALREKARALC